MNTLIKKVIKDIIDQFGNNIDSIKYQFIERSNTHFIEIKPSTVLNTEQFDDCSYEWIHEFMDSDDGGILSFLTDGSLTVLDAPQSMNFPNSVASVEEVKSLNNLIINSNSLHATNTLVTAYEEDYALAA